MLKKVSKYRNNFLQPQNDAKMPELYLKVQQLTNNGTRNNFVGFSKALK